MLENYVVIDLEMTGLDVKTDVILEVGAVRVRGGREADCYTAMLDTGRKLSDKVVELTGITQEMADAGADPKRSWKNILLSSGKMCWWDKM